METKKIIWSGIVISIQPRTRVWRYLTDNRTHYHIGYNLFLNGCAYGMERSFVIAISEKQQQKGGFRIGDELEGAAWVKEYPEREFADFYRAGALKRLKKAEQGTIPLPPPYIFTPLDMATYEWRGARMLSKSLWKSKCFQCTWATMSNVEIIWDFDKKINKYRFESFCYGPKSCKLYKMGKARSVPYRNRNSSLDTGWLDDIITERRDYDE